MSNRAYLTCCDHERIYPAFGDLSFEPRRDVVLACDGCVPLLWLALFAASDLRTHTFTLRGQDVSAVAPLAERTPAIARLRAREAFFNAQFAPNGGVGALLAPLVQHLEAQPGKFLSIELEEIEALHGAFDIPAVLTKALQLLDADDPKCLDLLVPLSTVIESRTFLAPEQAAASGVREDLFNVYRLIGGGWVAPTPWDGIDGQIELHRALNTQRRRDAFALRISQ